MQTDGRALDQLREFLRLFDLLADHVERSVYGKRAQVERALMCLLAGGHLLLDDMPGVGKTTLARALAAVVQDDTTSRIQGTPDPLPSGVPIEVVQMIVGHASPDVTRRVYRHILRKSRRSRWRKPRSC